MGIWYFFRNIIKIIFLCIGISLLSNFSENVAGNIALGVFLFFLFFATVSTTYDLGGGWFLKITTGVGLGGAVIGFFLVAALMTWIEAHTSIVIGILLASFVINHIIETIKYFEELPIFFTITGAFCVLIYIIEMFCAFFQKPSFLFTMEYEGFGGMIKVLLMFLTVILTLVNIIARATQASYVED